MQTSHKRKKAFTLTELLVVVIVIGVLSAVVLPKFSKVVETRKTTEAEELMSAVRTEQEKRCALDKNYLTDLAKMSEIIPDTDTKNFTYTATTTGIKAQSKGKYNYTLEMPSYRDGRLCCESAEECAKLNKDYPLCSSLIARADYRSGAECAGGEVQPEPEPAECTDGEVSGSQPCNDCGTQTTQKCVGGKWTASLGACSKTAEECAPAPEPAECTAGTVETGESCGNCGTNTRTCGADGSWGSWTCTGQGECTPSAPVMDTTGCEFGYIMKYCTNTCEWKEVGNTCCNTSRTLVQSFYVSHPGAETRTNACSSSYGPYTCTSADANAKKQCNDYTMGTEQGTSWSWTGAWSTVTRCEGLTYVNDTLSSCSGISTSSFTWSNNRPVVYPDATSACKSMLGTEYRSSYSCVIKGPAYNDPSGCGASSNSKAYEQIKLTCTGEESTGLKYVVKQYAVDCCVK